MSKIFGWSAGFSGCEYYRLTLPLQALTNLGHEARVSASLLVGDWRDYDVIIGQRICNPGPFALWQAICKNPNTLAVYEIDDDLFCLHDKHAPAVRDFWTDDRLKVIAKAAEMADVVTVTTAPLADVMRQFNRNVHIIPNYIDELALGIPVSIGDLPKRTGETAAGTLIGYQAASNHGRDFQEAWPSIQRLLRQNPRAYFASMGESYVGNGPASIANKIRHFPWVDRDWDRYYRNQATLDVGIAPLSDNRFNQSKSSIKALELAAVGVPCVATATYAYNDFIKDGETGYLVPLGTDHLWHKRLQELVNEPLLAQALGDAAWRLASQHTIQENVDLWRTALGLTLNATPSLVA